MSSTEVQHKHEHLITIESQDHPFPRTDGRVTSFRAACACGQSRPWHVNRDTAREDGRHHFVAAETPPEPTVLPPCPSWCTLTTVRQQGYDELTEVDAETGEVSWVRYHVLIDMDVHQRRPTATAW